MAVLLLLCAPASSRAEVLVRWDQAQIPSRDSLGLPALVVPAKNTAAVADAMAQGYRVYLEVEAAALTGFFPPSDRLSIPD